MLAAEEPDNKLAEVLVAWEKYEARTGDAKNTWTASPAIVIAIKM